MVLSAPTIETVLKEFLDFCGDAVLVAHNAEFDTSFIANKAQKQGITVNNTILDTVLLAQFVIPNLHNYKLDTLCKHLGVSLETTTGRSMMRAQRQMPLSNWLKC